MVGEIDDRPIQALCGPGLVRPQRISGTNAVHAEHDAHPLRATYRYVEEKITELITDFREVIQVGVRVGDLDSRIPDARKLANERSIWALRRSKVSQRRS